MSRPPVARDAVPAPETMQARMTGWRAAHPRATFAEIEGEATRQVAALLLADLPELGTCSGKEIAALVGVAPITQQSGAARGQDHAQGGRHHVRAALESHDCRLSDPP